MLLDTEVANVTLQTQSLLQPSAQTVAVDIGHATLALTWLDKWPISTQTDSALLDELSLSDCHYLTFFVLVRWTTIVLWMIVLVYCPSVSGMTTLSVHGCEIDVRLWFKILSECLLSEFVILHSFNCLIILWAFNYLLSLSINLHL